MNIFSPLLLLLVARVAPALAADSPSLAGSWSVVSTFTSSTCAAPRDTGGTDAYSWLVSTGADGSYSVTVQGRTSYPSLGGRSDHGVMRLAGLENAGAIAPANRTEFVAGDLVNAAKAVYRYSRADFVLELKDGALVGTRTVLLDDGPFSLANAEAGAVYYTPCRVEAAVVAKRS